MELLIRLSRAYDMSWKTENGIPTVGHGIAHRIKSVQLVLKDIKRYA